MAAPASRVYPDPPDPRRSGSYSVLRLRVEGGLRSGSLRRPDDAGGPALGCDQGLMSVRPPDPVADAHLTVDDFQNLALTRRGADLR